MYRILLFSLMLFILFIGQKIVSSNNPAASVSLSYSKLDLAGKKLICHSYYFISAYHFEDRRTIARYKYRYEPLPKIVIGQYAASEFSETIDFTFNEKINARDKEIKVFDDLSDYLEKRYEEGVEITYLERKTLEIKEERANVFKIKKNPNFGDPDENIYCKLFKGNLEELKKLSRKENLKRNNMRLAERKRIQERIQEYKEEQKEKERKELEKKKKEFKL